MGSLCSTNSEDRHDCDETCFGTKISKQQHLCRWFPSRPFKWEYTNDHSISLKSTLNKDQQLNEIGQDVINIIEEYIISMVIAEKDKKISYKRIHSTIYDETDSIFKNCKICNDYLMESGYHYDPKAVSQRERRENGEKDLKIVVLGQDGVGKSTLCRRIVCDNFYEEYDPGIEDSYRKVVGFGKDQEMIYDLLDTVGQEEFMSMVNHWIRFEGHQFWLCFDLLRTSTFEYLMDMLLPRIIKIREGKDISIIIIGCKSDLKFDDSHYYSDQDKVESVYVMNRIEEIGDFPYIETSSKQKINTLYLEKVAIYEHWIQTESAVIDWDALCQKYENFKLN